MPHTTNSRVQLLSLINRLNLFDNVSREDALSSKDGVIAAVAKFTGYPEWDLIRKTADLLGITTVELDKDSDSLQSAIFRLWRDSAREIYRMHKMIPYEEEGDVIYVACVNPLDYEGLKSLEFVYSKKIEPVLTKESDVQRILSRNLLTEKVMYDRSSVEASGPVEILEVGELQGDLDDHGTRATPIIKLVNKLLIDAFASLASDIHLEPTSNGLDVRFRVDGVMRHVLEVPKRLQFYVTSRVKIIAKLDIAERRRPQDGRFRARIDNAMCDVRVSTVPTAYGEKVVMRLLRNSPEGIKLTDLGISEGMRRSLLNILSRKGKLLLVTGPTGSGKTTTLYGALTAINDGSKNIQTVEDPVELRLKGVNQIQVNESANLTFASALRSILRQDPDVILIGEIRDSETAKIAMQAAQTGHLVLSTVHAQDAITSMIRLQDLGVEPYVVASSLGGVLAQRLMRKLCTQCCRRLSTQELAARQEVIDRYGLNADQLCIADGCAECEMSGSNGRVGVFSLLEVNDSIAHLIASRASHRELSQAAKSNGYVSLSQRVIELLHSGVIGLDEALGLIGEESELQNSFGVVQSRMGKAVSGVEQREVLNAISMLNKQSTMLSQQSDAPLAKSDRNTNGRLDRKTDRKTDRVVSKMKILLIEDEEDTRAVLSLLLRKEMFDVVEAENGLDGLTKVYEAAPDAIVCDLMMPEMDGREFLIKMRQNRNTAQIPVIFLTASGDELNEVDLLSLGATEFLRKSSSSSLITTRIRKVLNRD